MTSTATDAVSAAPPSAVTASHPTNVTSAIIRTTGTNTALTRSASRCTGACPFCACVTSRPIRASVVSAPTRVARPDEQPDVLTVPPTTAAGGADLDRHGVGRDQRRVDGAVPFDDERRRWGRCRPAGRRRSPTTSGATGTSPRSVSRRGDAQLVGPPRADPKQRTKRGSRPSLRAGLGVAAGEHENGDDGRALEVELGEPLSAEGRTPTPHPVPAGRREQHA